MVFCSRIEPTKQHPSRQESQRRQQQQKHQQQQHTYRQTLFLNHFFGLRKLQNGYFRWQCTIDYCTTSLLFPSTVKVIKEKNILPTKNSKHSFIQAEQRALRSYISRTRVIRWKQHCRRSHVYTSRLCQHALYDWSTDKIEVLSRSKSRVFTLRTCITTCCCNCETLLFLKVKGKILTQI